MADWTQKLRLHHWQTLVMMAEQGNLTQVARMMNITQPALSKWLLSLEEDVGFALFERHRKGLRPTEGGKLLLEHAQRVINDVQRSRSELERFRRGGMVGSLKVGCSPVATDCVAQAILNLLEEMPELNLQIAEMVMTPLLQDLLAGNLDVVVGRVGGKALNLPLNYRVLYTEPVCFVARTDHPLARQSGISWDALASWRWIVWPASTPIRISIDSALVDNGIMMPENTIESASMNVTLNMLQSSDMISILSWRLARRYARQGQLAILALPRIEQQGSVGVFWRKDLQASTALQRFILHLQQQPER
ncbi:LysR substrate-binding domain-containing protein [Shimwellia blattae]|uniref:Putative transcriptional regulator n=1 Tax=Shimwellia blattae (strain ATCC 29907 / DSM 4481 / JCM 1650 / NBRC 105725 / CDC 9005-74) TaxID=630626 RepID=I2B7G2_SHIBC|nr:LysR substrate-binding domain-containing protein [Shimwellia blattae]AFJ46466.1 putative transcriptional regulator [Shimwellia blattae DSM 4481 = NBRC 105725]GAB80047.1 putative LysR family transcriptional regulator [Shimwellia blattae DSM 4481 = NBRC 105725]VDY63934.1 Galactose-binding protein regulator [Shimwellia blattae]VEC22070.1 Galactose-binding protein regulator [Shimwellia blattae]